MRILPLVAFPLASLSLAPPARADSVLELAGGFMTPVGDDAWTDVVDSSPKFALRAGAIGTGIGGLVSVDWTPVELDNPGLGSALDVSANRFRVLLHAAGARRVAPRLTVSGRLGLGLDITRVSVESSILGVTRSDSDSDSGLALEAAGGLWFDVGAVEIGGELAVPISIQDDGTDENLDSNDYTSIDLDVLFGVRFRSL